MMKHLILGMVALLFLACGQAPERNCKDFKTGKFTYTAIIDGEEKKTIFDRTLDLEVDEFEGKKRFFFYPMDQRL